MLSHLLIFLGLTKTIIKAVFRAHLGVARTLFSSRLLFKLVASRSEQAGSHLLRLQRFRVDSGLTLRGNRRMPVKPALVAGADAVSRGLAARLRGLLEELAAESGVAARQRNRAAYVMLTAGHAHFSGHNGRI